MNKKELGESITRNEKRFAACEDIVNLLESAIGILRVAKKRQSTVYESIANGEYSAEMLTILGDLASMKKEYSDIASEIADDIEKARRDREEC